MEEKKKKRKKTKIIHKPSLGKQAAAARERGQVRFTPILPCKAGHTERYVSSLECVGCRHTPQRLARNRLAAKNYRAAHPELVAKYVKTWQLANPEKMAASRLLQKRKRVEAKKDV